MEQRTIWDRTVVRVGVESGDIVGSTNIALQAAVDFVGQRGGGTVEVGEGVFLMQDALHMRSGVRLIGQGGSTVLCKDPGVRSALYLDGDHGEEQITPEDPGLFSVGMGVRIADSQAGGFHVTVRTIIGRDGSAFLLDGPLLADYLVSRGADAANAFPVISGRDVESLCIEGITVDGQRESNASLNGCRGAGIYLYGVREAQIRDCLVRDYYGDGISFQKSDDVTVAGCRVLDCAELGIHPGSGSQRPQVTNCEIHRSGRIGLFVCWRVRDGVFDHNRIVDSGQAGISIGHKDTDNVIRHTEISGSGQYGVHFRDELVQMGAHRNRIEECRIVDNGSAGDGCGIFVEGETHDLVIRKCEITSSDSGEVQGYGIRSVHPGSTLHLAHNQVTGHAAADVAVRGQARRR